MYPHRYQAAAARSLVLILALCGFEVANSTPLTPHGGATPSAQQVLQYSAPLRSGTIDLTLKREAARLVLRDGGSVVASGPLSEVVAVAIHGPDRVDTSLTIDYGSGAIRVPIDYHPGALGPATNNTLTLLGGAASAQRHTVTGPHSGTIEVDGVPIAYKNLTPITDTTPAISYTFNVFAGTTVNIVQGPVVSGFQTMTINDGGAGAFEMTSIANKTNVTVNVLSGTAITVNDPTIATGLTTMNLVGAGGGSLTFDGFAGASTINVVDGPILSGNQSTQINDGGTFKFAPINFTQIASLIVSGNGATVTFNNPTLAMGLSAIEFVRAGGSNIFNISPSQTLPILVNGSLPIPPAPADTLNINTTGVTGLTVASGTSVFGAAGAYTFSNRASVYFKDMATISPPALLPPTCLAPTPALGTAGLVILGLLIGVLAWKWVPRRA